MADLSFLNGASYTQDEYKRYPKAMKPYSNAVVSVSYNPSNKINRNLRIKNLFETFKGLQDNWDGEDAKAPSPKVIQDAYSSFNFLDNFEIQVYHAAPGPWGEIMLDIRDETTKRGMEIIFYENRKVYVTIDQNGEMKQGDFDEQIIPELLQWIHSKN